MRIRLLLLWIFASVMALPAHAAPSLVFDARSGEVLLAQEAGEAWHPASLTKLMTTYLTFHAIKVGRLKLDQKIVISKRAAKEPPSKLGMKPGSKISVDFAISYLLVRSGNDIAVALAEAVAGDVESFVELMNAAAQRLGMTATHFVNPHGLHDPAQVTTARDMGLLAATLVHEFPEYRSFLAKPFVKIGKKKLRNRNRLIGRMKGADGMKTGFVCASGFNLVASATRNGRQLVAVVMGHKSAPARTEAAALLLEASFAKNGESYLGEGGRITQIENVAGEPQNMRADVCKRLGVKLIKPAETQGWGVTLGKYKNLAIADALLNAEIVLTRSLIDTGKAGVMRIPFTKTYAATLWAMNETNAQDLCTHLKARNRSCEVMEPKGFAELASKSKAEEVKRKKRLAARKAKKAKRKKKRRKKKKKN